MKNNKNNLEKIFHFLNSRNSTALRIKEDILNVFAFCLKNMRNDKDTCLQVFYLLCDLRKVKKMENVWSVEADIAFDSLLSNYPYLRIVFDDLVLNEKHPKILILKRVEFSKLVMKISKQAECMGNKKGLLTGLKKG